MKAALGHREVSEATEIAMNQDEASEHHWYALDYQEVDDNEAYRKVLVTSRAGLVALIAALQAVEQQGVQQQLTALEIADVDDVSALPFTHLQIQEQPPCTDGEYGECDFSWRPVVLVLLGLLLVIGLAFYGLVELIKQFIQLF